MHDEQFGRLLRMIRLRAATRQQTVAVRAGVSRSTISRIESGLLDRFHLDTVRRHARALGLTVELRCVGRGGDLARLVEEEHAMIVEWLATWLSAHGWTAVPEASFNVYGERGRLDLLAFHPATRTLLVVEVKTELTDLQALLGGLDVRMRLAATVAANRGWSVGTVEADGGQPRLLTLLAVADTPAAHRIVRRHPALFARFNRHGLSVRAQLARPTRSGRLLMYVPAHAASRRRTHWVATRRRVDDQRHA
jgi:transcriptional regulator with XRE-family HTH domain